MDRNNVARLIDFIEAEPDGFLFDMGNFARGPREDDPPCKTAGCIAGGASILEGTGLVDRNGQILGEYTISPAASRFLDIWKMQGRQLFYGEDDYGQCRPISHITRDEAVETLRRLMDTGEVDWSHSKVYEPYE